MKKEIRHLISMDDIDRDFIMLVFKLAAYYMNIIEGTANWLHRFWYVFRRTFNCLPLSGKIIANFFYEPSTRTRLSFDVAAKLLGGMVIGTENAGEFSSAAKGETTRDSTRVIGGYAQAIVMRHFKEGSAKEARDISKVPIINAGDGTGEHPTQTLLDLFTIWRKLGRIDNLTIALAGDLKNGRTIHSIIKGLVKCCRNNRFILIAPSQLALPDEYKKLLDDAGIKYEEFGTLDEAPIECIDCLYMTRIQKERFMDNAEYEAIKDSCILRLDIVGRMKTTAIVMHPLPRVNEIPEEVDDDPRAVYFDQAKYGPYVRMAILHILLNH